MRRCFLPSPPTTSCSIFIVDMPATEKRATAKRSVYAWTTGNKRSVAHVEPIGKGGFGEVHKV
jgi:hypothetical protein